MAGALADPRRRFLAADGLIDPARAEAGRLLLERHLLPHLARIDRPIPPEATWEMTENYGELLPKTARVSTATFERRREPAGKAAEQIGLAAMLRSASFRGFAEALAGRPLARRWGMQVLCYGPGDYAGPHNDHHPEDPRRARAMSTSISPSTRPAVAHQWLVYAAPAISAASSRSRAPAASPPIACRSGTTPRRWSPSAAARPRRELGAAGDVSISVAERLAPFHLSPRPPKGGEG